MIEQWDIKNIDGTYAILLECGEAQARLLKKKLDGHVREPIITSIAPYNYRFDLSAHDPDSLEKIRVAVREFVEESKNFIPFSSAGLMGAAQSNTPIEGTVFNISRDPDLLINKQYQNIESPFTSLDLDGGAKSLRLSTEDSPPAQIKPPYEDTTTFNSRELFFDDPHTVRHPIEDAVQTVTDLEVNHDFEEQDKASASEPLQAPEVAAEEPKAGPEQIPSLNLQSEPQLKLQTPPEEEKKEPKKVHSFYGGGDNASGSSEKLGIEDVLSAKTMLDVFATSKLDQFKNPASAPADGEVAQILADAQKTSFNIFEQSGTDLSLSIADAAPALDPFDLILQEKQVKQDPPKKKVIAPAPAQKEPAAEAKPRPAQEKKVDVLPLGASVEHTHLQTPKEDVAPAIKLKPMGEFVEERNIIRDEQIAPEEKHVEAKHAETVVTERISEVNVERVKDESEFLNPFDELELENSKNNIDEDFFDKFKNNKKPLKAEAKTILKKDIMPPVQPPQELKKGNQQEIPEEADHHTHGEEDMQDNREDIKQVKKIDEKESSLPPPPPMVKKTPSAPVAPAVQKPEVKQEEPKTMRTTSPRPPDPSLTNATSNKIQHSFYGARKPSEEHAIDHSIELADREKHNWPLEIPLVPTFTFESMVIGANRFAHATAISVIDNPGNLYNPLVLHGGAGTGKTHFLNAIGYALSKKFGQQNIFMTNGVRFSRGIQRYVVEGKIDKFDEFIDGVKAVLIDDIHLTAVNEQNREYISKYLNNCIKQGKQVVITSKYPPESLMKLEELIGFKLDAGWISELKSATGANHAKIVKKMLADNNIELADSEIETFFKGMSLSVIYRTIKRAKVLANVLSTDGRQAPDFATLFEKLLAVSGEDIESAVSVKEFSQVTQIPVFGRGEWGKIGIFYPQDNANLMKWMAYCTGERAKELGVKGGYELALKSSYNPANIISSAFKIANICDNKKLKGAIILGPSTDICDGSVRENFYDILTHMLEIMLIRCGVINFEHIKAPSAYARVIAELLK